EPASNRYGTRWTTANDDGPTKEPAMIRIERNEGSWEFTPLDNGRRTLATYVLHTDPGGQLPSWASAWANLRAIPDVFSALRRTVISWQTRNPGQGQHLRRVLGGMGEDAGHGDQRISGESRG